MSPASSGSYLPSFKDQVRSVADPPARPANQPRTAPSAKIVATNNDENAITRTQTPMVQAVLIAEARRQEEEQGSLNLPDAIGAYAGGGSDHHHTVSSSSASGRIERKTMFWGAVFLVAVIIVAVAVVMAVILAVDDSSRSSEAVSGSDGSPPATETTTGAPIAVEAATDNPTAGAPATDPTTGTPVVVEPATANPTTGTPVVVEPATANPTTEPSVAGGTATVDPTTSTPVAVVAPSADPTNNADLITPAPTADSSTAAPTAKCLPPEVDIDTSTERYLALRAIFDPVYGAEMFADEREGNHRFRALHWIANEDLLQLDLENTPAQLQKIQQRYVLVLFYFSTQGWCWTNNLNWLSAVSECRWEHIVQCASESIVQKIDIDRNNLAGTVPGEMRLLSSHLVSFDLGTLFFVS